MSGGYRSYRERQGDLSALHEDWMVILLGRHGLSIQVFGSETCQLQFGESPSGIEFKLNDKYTRTKNLWIEIEERATPADIFRPAGCFADDNAWLWVTGDFHTTYFFSKKHLQRLSLAPREILTNKFDTGRGYLLSEAEARKEADLVLDESAPECILKKAAQLRAKVEEAIPAALPEPTPEPAVAANDREWHLI